MWLPFAAILERFCSRLISQAVDRPEVASALTLYILSLVSGHTTEIDNQCLVSSDFLQEGSQVTQEGMTVLSPLFESSGDREICSRALMNNFAAKESNNHLIEDHRLDSEIQPQASSSSLIR